MKHIFLRTLLSALFVLTAQLLSAQSLQQSTFEVNGACGMCKQRIEKTAKQAGAATARWDLKTHRLTITFDISQTSSDSIQQAIAVAGHDTEKYRAEDATYEALPDCCLYREAHNHDDAHTSIHGIVLSEDNKGNFVPLEGATIVWMSTGVGTVSDKNGVFTIQPDEPDDRLIISYAGYTPDTLTVTNMNDIQIILGSNNMLNAVQVTATTRSRYINKFNPVRTEILTSKELMKAACCNLSESFETNPSVDVSYSDAVSGSKQIQLLGLAGIYSQLTVENMPGPRGLATAYGLLFIPGPWIENIQLSKGTGSVVNGFESIAGQINIELKKPHNSEHLFANGYVNNQGKTDLNLTLAKQVGARWHTGLLLHNASFYNQMDFNKDGFRDQPNGNLFTLMNRWYYENHQGLEAQIGVKYLSDRKTGGATGFNAKDKLTTERYGVVIENDRYEIFGKLGYVFPNKKYRSIGLQVSAFEHNQDAYFGITPYIAKQYNFYSNLIYQDILFNSKHVFKTGLSFTSDEYKERFRLQPFNRNEKAAGGFFEYAYTPNEKFALVAGLRADNNNLYGWAVTPRLNVRFEPITGTTIRISGGRGQRTANIFAENMATLASSRIIEIVAPENGKAYGLDAEVSWNKGISIDQQLKLFGRTASVGIDFYRNDFVNQVVVDMEDARKLRFYNLDGKSYSNSLQVEFNMSPIKNLETRWAYRWFDVKTTYGNSLLQKPLTAVHRAFVNVGYEYKSWKFDYTVNFTGSKRLPSTESNPEMYRFRDESPSYVTMNAQVSKMIIPKYGFEIYVGGENLGNFLQRRAIIAADQPFSEYFDASMIWGPLQERMFYAGFRFKLN